MGYDKPKPTYRAVCIKCQKADATENMTLSSGFHYCKTCADAFLDRPEFHHETYKVPERHLAKAKEFAGQGRYMLRKCKRCNNTGWTGVNIRNELIVCHKCVDEQKAHGMWSEYVKQVKAEYASAGVKSMETEAFLREYPVRDLTTEITEITEEESYTEDTEGHGKEGEL